MEAIKQKVIKGYELKEQIGTGGFGAVYRAVQSTVGREVAVKIILPALANQADFIRRFEGEAQVVARLEHPHITPLYDYWRDPDGAYLVMRWLRGGSLRDALEASRFELRTTALLLDQIAGALSLAHRNGIIHRDIKPANILLHEDGNAYLTDFGIAKDLNIRGDNTQPDMIVGSLDYISPEQARSEPVTSRTDIYSLGVTLYEIITGHHPFENLTSVERLYKHINDPLPEITDLDTAIAADVNRVIQTATAKNPEQRYAEALAFAADFREAIGLNRTSTTVLELLTQREHEILQLIIEGLSNKEIAQRLTITHGTVKWYVNQIYEKLGVRSRVQAMVRTRELNLLVKGNGVFEAMPIATEDFQPENPYKGLRAFQSADNQDFFGREKITAKLLKRMTEKVDFGRFLAVVGPSGSGKSSLVKAGLIPALWRGELPTSEKWYIVEMTPATRPLDELEIALTKLAANQAGNLHEHLQRDINGLLRAASLILPNDGTELVLVIDQFEEVFTMSDDEEARKHFLDLLHAAVSDAKSRIRVIITLRADFYDRPLHYPNFGEMLRSRLETILPLSAEELECAISKPAERVGAVFEAGLVASMVADLNYQAGALPLLQYALTELFEQRKGRLLSREAYEAMGKSTGALAKRADEVYAGFDEKGKAAAKQLFLRLVTVTEGAEDTRRRALRMELLALGDDAETMDEVIDTYSSYRLLTLDNEPLSREPTIELAHEAILREWERLRQWLNDSRVELRVQRQLSTMAKEWTDSQQDRSFLARGLRLDSFEAWSQNTQILLTPHEHDFLSKSLAGRNAEVQKEAEQQAREKALKVRSVRMLQLLVAVFALASLLSVGLAVFAFNREGEAQDARALSDANFHNAESQRLAAESTNVLQRGDSPELAALLAIRGLQAQYSSQADAALLNASRFDYGERVFQAGESVTTIAYSPDGRYILNSGDTRTELWDTQTGSQLHSFAVKTWNAGSAAAFSPDSNTVIVGNDIGEVHIWDTVTGAEFHVFSASPSPINCVAYSPDGRYILIASEDQVHLMDAASGTVVHSFNGGSNGIAFSPDSQRIVVSSGDEVRVWEVESGTLIWTAPVANTKNGAVFSPDNQYVLVASFDKTAHLLDVATGQEIRQFVGHKEGVFTGIFSPDGQYVLTASLDQTARLWDTATGEELRRFLGHTACVYVVAFTPDGRHILTAGRDATVRLWDIQASNDRGTFSGAQGFMYGLSFSPDGQSVLIGTDDHTARLFETATANQLQVFTHPSALQAVQFAPDGNSILTGNVDGIVRLWNARNGEMQRSFDEVMYSPMFSLDGRFILAGSDAGTVLWDAVSGEQLHTVEQVGTEAFSPDSQYFALTNGDYEYVSVHETASGNLLNTIHVPGTPLSGVFSPDNRYILTGGRDNILRLWDVATGQLVRQFIGHTNTVWNVAYSPDGRTVLSSSFDKTARLWDAATGEQLRSFPSHNFSAVSIVAYSPDGRYILIGSTDGTAQLANVGLDTLIQSVCTRLLRDFTDAERTIYSITDDAPTCL
jgi:WD40 repeat protein/serine/threonine protein kinase/energy-coupling factor transporter ATP-binding protein EcfA2